MNSPLSTPERLLALKHLVALSRADLMYADQYMRRAEELLQGICTREQYAHLRLQRRRFTEVSSELAGATETADWQRVRSLAKEASRIQDDLLSHTAVLATADVVYGPRILEPDAHSLALTGVVRGPSRSLQEAITSLTQSLESLATVDPEWQRFYLGRAAFFKKTQIESEERAGPRLDRAHLTQRIQKALKQGRFQEVQRLADALAVNPQQASVRVRVASPVEDSSHRLASPFPEIAVERSAALGLSLETLLVDDVLNSYLSCRCSDAAQVPSAALSETNRKPEGDTCGHDCPPEVPSALRDNLDLLIIHPFITSVGTHYLPWFGEETLLVETFAEEGDDSGHLLAALGLTRRTGLSRIQIEDALASHGPLLCAGLGLDPIDFAVVCIPFDAYLRLADKYGWGRQPHWTHFDGFQLLQDAHLRALVGGDARYGGPHDLCSIDRTYGTERLLARFAIVRRERFTMHGCRG